TLRGEGPSIDLRGESRTSSATRASQWTIGPLPPSDGRLRASAIPPGAHVAGVQFGKGVTGWIETPVFTAHPGEQITQPLELPRLCMRLHIFSLIGEPLANTLCTLTTSTSVFAPSEFTTDADGWITLAPAPAVPVSLIVANGKGGRAG